MVGRYDRSDVRIIREIPKNFGWAGISFEKKDFKNYIQVQERTNKNGDKFGIEYMLVEGRLKIFNEVCEKKGWKYTINYEIIQTERIQTEKPKNDQYAKYDTIKYFVLLSCTVTVKDNNDNVLFQVNSFNMDEVALGTNDFKKLQTNALGRCLNLLGVGLEIAIQEENMEENVIPAQKAIPTPKQFSKEPTMSVNDIYQKLLAMAKENPEIIDMIKEELAFYGVKKFTELTEDQAKAIYNMVTAHPEEEDVSFDFGEEEGEF